ncbi:DUF3626 domain-containing protein [Burkholderia territorii]|uniref:DUF3626 domain-containing protein n=1 Tax=Burkholderia territorii TaxID=1503055 RepID=UPI00075C369F|nr:DUF3626 domain-containing protein [Burkholderia territorii]KWA12369.1 hypothetical protein WT36_05830 [Burkholderia territorii]
MDSSAERALAHIRRSWPSGQQGPAFPVTLNFHPDTLVDGVGTLERIVRDGVYRSQFETATSNGGLTAYPGGDRWHWESRMFGGAYDGADPALRPKYGALNHRLDPVGGSCRFGSCHLRLRSDVHRRTTFCYPDSHYLPSDFAIGDCAALIALATENRDGLDPLLDNYIEAHVHGVVSIDHDVDAIVLDPSYRHTPVETAAVRSGCRVEWHGGFRLSLDRLAECERFRGPPAADAIARIAVDGIVTPAVIGHARDGLLDYQTAKWVWHCVARFGQTSGAAG